MGRLVYTKRNISITIYAEKPENGLLPAFFSAQGKKWVSGKRLLFKTC